MTAKRKAKPITLDSSDWFEACLIDLVKINRSKRADYAVDGNPFSNFIESAAEAGLDSPIDSVNHLIAVKNSRLRALKANGREPNNESVVDTYLDRATYAVIAYAMLKGGVV